MRGIITGSQLGTFTAGTIIVRTIQLSAFSVQVWRATEQHVTARGGEGPTRTGSVHLDDSVLDSTGLDRRGTAGDFVYFSFSTTN